MPQPLVSQNPITVTTTDALPLDEAAFLKVLNGALDSSLGNSNLRRNLAQDRRLVRVQ